MALLVTVTVELLCINMIKLSGILVPFSCQKCCLGDRNTPVSGAYARRLFKQFPVLKTAQVAFTLHS